MIGALLISFKVVTVSLVISFIIGLLLAWRVSYKFGKLEKTLEWIGLIPMFFPPSAIGYFALLFLGRNSFIGKILYEQFNYRFVFTWEAGVIVISIVIFPIMYKSFKNGFAQIPTELKEVASELGLSKIQRLKYVDLPMIKKNIFSGLILGFGRGFGEFGATIMVMGNIPGKTQTIPMALYSSVESGDYSEANKIFIVIILISGVVVTLYNYLLKKEW
ncbi:MAG: molybdate ABC transporter permease subunit [Fusobacteriaceae bacterium]